MVQKKSKQPTLPPELGLASLGAAGGDAACMHRGRGREDKKGALATACDARPNPIPLENRKLDALCLLRGSKLPARRGARSGAQRLDVLGHSALLSMKEHQILGRLLATCKSNR